MFLKFAKWALGLITGGSLDRILDTIDHKMDDGTKKEEIKAEVTKTYVNAQANLMVGRTWWFQLFFVIPMAVHWSALNWVSTFPQYGWVVHPLPSPFDEYEGWIISALFLVDGSKAILGRWKK
ncbi:hypothetical protein [Mesorhizobium sp. M1252]|uniref:hypothetical protein n=1 Tax=Mesorhizobium sp. M1252 TaxID=2957073 RepID=UPI00333DB4BC